MCFSLEYVRLIDNVLLCRLLLAYVESRLRPSYAVASVKAMFAVMQKGASSYDVELQVFVLKIRTETK